MKKLLLLTTSLSVFFNIAQSESRDGYVRKLDTVQQAVNGFILKPKDEVQRFKTDITYQTATSDMDTAGIPQVVVTSQDNAVVIDAVAVYKIIPFADNTVSLMRLNADWHGENKPFVRFNFVNLGEIRYSYNTWLSGIDSFELNAPGTTFRCTSASPMDVDKMPFYNTGIFFQNRLTGWSDNTGQIFKTVSKGQQSIYVDPIEMTLYKPGDRVYLAGYAEQLDNIPINPRFYEWKIIKDVTSTGIITFTEPLKWSYNEAWQDVNVYEHGMYGKPRIYPLKNYTRYAKFIGCTMAKGPNARTTVPNAFIFRADVLICEGLTIEGDVWPSENRMALYTNCKMNGAEPDKNVELCVFYRCNIGAIYAATGVDSLVIKNSNIKSSSMVSPRILYAENNTFNARNAPNLYPHNEGTFIQKVYLKSNTFSGGDPGLAHTTFWYTKKTFITTGATTSDIITVDVAAIKGMSEGSYITSNDGACGTVGDITWNGSAYVVKLVDKSGTLKVGQVWTYNANQKVVDLGGNKSANGRKIY